MLLQLFYEARFTAIVHYYAQVKKTKITKQKVKEEALTLTKEEFMEVSNMSCYSFFVVNMFCSSNANFLFT